MALFSNSPAPSPMALTQPANNQQSAQNFAQQNLGGQPITDNIQMPSEKITTMPENYLQPMKTKKSIPWIWLAVGGGAIVIITALAAYFLLQPAAPAPIVNQPATNQQPTTPSATDTTQTPPANTTTTAQLPTPTGTPIERDQQRYFDVGTITKALELYYADNGSYPIEPSGRPLSGAVGALTNVGFRADNPAGVRVYLKILPTPPVADGYFYKSADGKDFTLMFTLENGIAKLATGAHTASRGGIDIDLSKTEDNSSKIYRSSLDTDKDSLTDMEEELYGTDSRKADTDGDSYADGHEIENGYNPLIAGSARWNVSGKVLVYTNPNHNYTLLYPAKWTAQAADIQLKEVQFVSSDEEQYMSIKYEDNPKGLTPLLWYQSLGRKDYASMRAVKISDLDGLISPDGLSLYLGGGTGKPLFVFTYNVGLKNQLDYFFTFTMMQNSFIVKAQNVNNQVNSAPTTQ